MFCSLGPRRIRSSHAVQRVDYRAALPTFASHFRAGSFAFRLSVQRVTVCLIGMVSTTPISMFMKRVMGRVVRKMSSWLLVWCDHLLEACAKSGFCITYSWVGRLRGDAPSFRIREDHCFCVFAIAYYGVRKCTRYFRGQNIVDGRQDGFLLVDLLRRFSIGSLQHLRRFVVVTTRDLTSSFHWVTRHFGCVGGQGRHFVLFYRVVAAASRFCQSGQASAIIRSRRPEDLRRYRAILRQVRADFSSIYRPVFRVRVIFPARLLPGILLLP